MNKTSKYALYSSLAIIIAGLSVAAVGAAYGGIAGARQIANQSKFISFSSSQEWSIDVSPMIDAGFDKSHDIKQGTYETFDNSSVKNLSIDLGSAELTINSTDDTDINIDMSDINKSQCYVEDGTLYIVAEANADGEMTIAIPENKEYNNISIKAGAAELTSEELTCDIFNLNIGAGKANFTNLTVNKQAEIDVGAGELYLENANISNINAEVGLGEFTFEGIIINDLNAKCGLGNMEFDLEDEEELHNYKCTVDFGNITIGDQQFTGKSSQNRSFDGITSTFTIECGLGNVEIDFN